MPIGTSISVIELLLFVLIFTITCFKTYKLGVLFVGKVSLLIMGFFQRSDVSSTALLELGSKEQYGFTKGQKLFENSLFSLLFLKVLVSGFVFY